MMLPRIAELEFNMEDTTEELLPIGKSFLFDFDKGEFVFRNGKMVELHGVESLKMWIRKVLRTERFRFKIYEDVPYGVLLEELIGLNLPRSFIESELQREVTESLLLSPYITDVQEWTFQRDGKKMSVFFRVISPMYNTFDMEVMV